MIYGNVYKECAFCHADVEINIDNLDSKMYGNVIVKCQSCGKQNHINAIKEIAKKIMDEQDRHALGDMKDSFDKLSSPLDKQMIMQIKANFHMRNGKKHEDGSMGVIDITPKQLNDCLAYTILETIKSIEGE